MEIVLNLLTTLSKPKKNGSVESQLGISLDVTNARAGSRAPRRVVWFAALGLAAAAGPAHAADALLAGAEPAAPDPAALAGAIIEETVGEEPVADAIVEQVSALPVEASTATAAEPAVTGAAAAPPPEPVVAAVPEAAPEPAPEALEADPEGQPVPAPVPDAPPVQQQPTNLNVSVRIDSPGDEGAVTQTNVAVDAVAQYQPDSVRYQPLVPPADTATEDQPATSAPDDDAGDAVSEAWEWEWTWDCGSDSPLELAPTAGPTAQTWIWNWTWTCDGITGTSQDIDEEIASGYQAPATQYRPVNINVAIRISSPGDNGPVVQTNVAVALPVPVPPVAAPIESPPDVPALPETSVPTIAVEVAVLGVGLMDAPAPAAIAPGDEADRCCVVPERRGDVWAAEQPTSGLFRQVQPEGRRDITAVDFDTAAVARLELRSRRAELAESAPPRPQARPAPPARERRHADGKRATVGPQGLPGLAPGGAPDRRLTYAIVALVAFALAYAFASWVAAGSRPTHGRDPDDPPDRPG